MQGVETEEFKSMDDVKLEHGEVHFGAAEHASGGFVPLIMIGDRRGTLTYHLAGLTDTRELAQQISFATYKHLEKNFVRYDA